MTIRLARKTDYSQVMALFNLFVDDGRFVKKSDDSYDRVIKNPNNFVYVATDAKKMIGFATLSVHDVIRYPKPIAALDELFVLREYRKKGVGRQLMAQVEKKSKALKCYRLYIESHKGRKIAHKFYEALGYAKNGYFFVKNL